MENCPLGAMLIISNRSVAEWGAVFADPMVATAILDRLLQHSHVLTIRGHSYRLRAKRKSGLIKAPVGGDHETEGRGQFFVTQRGQFRMAFDSLIARRSITAERTRSAAASLNRQRRIHSPASPDGSAPAAGLVPGSSLFCAVTENYRGLNSPPVTGPASTGNANKRILELND